MSSIMRADVAVAPNNSLGLGEWRRLLASSAWMAAGAFVMFVVGHAIITTAAAANARPSLEIAPIGDIDFGDVRIGATAERRFAIRNRGTQRLLITDLKSSCQCTASEIGSRSLNADETTELQIIFTPSIPGKEQQRVVLRSNDPQRPVMVINVAANAIPS